MTSDQEYIYDRRRIVSEVAEEVGESTRFVEACLTALEEIEGGRYVSFKDGGDPSVVRLAVEGSS